MERDYLFVYGSLAKGRKNAVRLEVIGGDWIPATVRGRLKNQGWGAKMGYPGLIIDDEGDPIEGFVFSSAYLKDYWKALDDFEGSEYGRVRVTAQLDSGQIIETFAYALK
ncbi:MAG: gamma-glutamylcyclotransferase family protein [Cyclobacteriaceae bacterium]